MQLLLNKVPKLLQSARVCPSCGSLNFRSGKEFYCNDCSLTIVER